MIFPPQIQSAAYRVYGYYLPRLGESAEKAFDRAKAEAITQLEISKDHITSLTIDQWKACKKADFVEEGGQA